MPSRLAVAESEPQLVPGALPMPTDLVARHAPAAAVAARLLSTFADEKAPGLIHIARSEREADEIARALRCFDPAIEVLLLPPWDCLPYDRTPPQRDCMGQRMAALAAIDRQPNKRRLVVTSPAAMLQGLPPANVVLEASFSIAIGDTLDRDALSAFLLRTGYILDDRVDEAGEAALLGDVVDIFPASDAFPVRVMLGDGDIVEDIRTYDPATQRTNESIKSLAFGPASEAIAPAGEEEADAVSGQSMEARMSALYDDMGTLFDRLPDFAVSLSEEADERADAALDLIKDALQARRDFGEAHSRGGDTYYIDAKSWKKALKSRKPVTIKAEAVEAVPRFTLETHPQKAFARFVKKKVEAGKRVVVTGVGPELRRLSRILARNVDGEVTSVDTWQAALETPKAGVTKAAFDLSGGFDDPDNDLVVVTASDLFGARLSASEATTEDLLSEPELRVGDVVIHEDHGVGVLRALESVTVDGAERDAVRLEYHGEASVLSPIEEFGRIWRYGAEAEAVKLDRLNTDAWLKRRAEVSREIDKAAADLIAAAKARAAETAEAIKPPRAAYAKFTSRFPYPETPDQAASIEAVLDDLESGKVMNRLICGDVGFGKTEIALRAAAAVALTGKQVAVVAPTTVLVRQHFENFQRRFADTGIKVGHLSRITAGSEMEAVKEGLKSGEIGIVVATQAVASDDVTFADLGLLVIDEEHRFGAKLKDKMRTLAPALHTLTMSATPIPRTLQSAMVGVQDVSILASPPARRRPIRTFLAPYDAASLKTALIREKRRGGQSFFVAPRIEDLGEIEALLKTLVPKLDLRVAHGKMDAKGMDEVMVGFAAGKGDILLSTNIIESGLDVPRANTMIVWRADRFGLAQLHQLRGRVGRGRTQGVTYLLTEADKAVPDATRSRLSTLVAFDRLGSGLAISARDLDLRGAGDLMGEEQAGHMKLIGVSLYQRLLAQAVDAARGDAAGDRTEPEINLEMAGSIPQDYVPEATIRLNLYARLQRITRTEELDAFVEEIADRFGEPPEAVTTLLDLARLKLLARDHGMSRIAAGPKATAISFRKTPTEARWKSWLKGEDVSRREDRLILAKSTEPGSERLELVRSLLETMA
ncbi:transcription-repair coupling factor [Tianweitania sp. BSSL-BM11]|uniref:Transcription-repair-coupling factor n=1 Tax=Tianweitania aestuarii TaxID=2814886 RepID=A0ABS5RXU1_9HYPH|nr:transcription-repair coupling factor [Tianweitania aestuarii]MBS9721870.1 transcription-repair coupling factor [Tianweitania aestuarii]